MDKNAQESFKKIVINETESTNSTTADVRKSLEIAFKILSKKNTRIVSFSPPELLVPLPILHVDGFEIKCPVYFSKRVETWRGMKVYAD